MVKGNAFVLVYSLILITLFCVFSYLMTTVDPHIRPNLFSGTTVKTLTQVITTSLPKSEPPHFAQVTEKKKLRSARPVTHAYEAIHFFPVPRIEYRRKDDNIGEITVRFLLYVVHHYHNIQPDLAHRWVSKFL